MRLLGIAPFVSPHYSTLEVDSKILSEYPSFGCVSWELSNVKRALIKPLIKICFLHFRSASSKAREPKILLVLRFKNTNTLAQEPVGWRWGLGGYMVN